MQKFVFTVLFLLLLCSTTTTIVKSWSITKVGTNNQDRHDNLIRLKGSGVQAPPFNATKFKNWQYDSRFPLISPKNNGAKCRNIYAAQAVNNGEACWNVFFGGWDGVNSCHDSISARVTEDSFDTFNPAVTVVATGSDIHANNPSIVKFKSSKNGTKPEEEWRMIYTQLPYSHPPRNKPGYTRSSNGINFNPSKGGSDFVKIVGYSKFDNADINGANVLFAERTNDDAVEYHLFFYDFQNTAPGILHAVSSSSSVSSFQFVGPIAPPSAAVHKIPNDLKKVNGNNFVLGFHENGAQVFAQFAFSSINGPFLPSTNPIPLFSHFSDADRYIVSVGFVVDQNNSRILGALYGAGAVSALDENRVFAAWLQRRVIFRTRAGEEMGVGKASRAVGPATSTIMLSKQEMIGTFFVYETDSDSLLGTLGTLLWKSREVTIQAGDVFELLE